MVVATLGPGHHQAWVQHVPLLLGASVDVGAPTSDLPPVHDDGGVDGDGVGLQGPGLGTLTLDLPALGISGPKQREGGLAAGEELGHRRASIFLDQHSRLGLRMGTGAMSTL